MREFIKLIESLNDVVEPQAPAQAPKTVERRAQAPAPVMESRAPEPKTGRLREAMAAKAKIKAMESARTDLKSRVESLRSRKNVLETRSSVLRAHPEFNLLRELMGRHGETGPQYGSVDYFIAEAYARGLTRETGMDRDTIMKEALVSLFDKPSRRPQRPAAQPEPEEETLPRNDMAPARPRDAEPAEESPVRNVAEDFKNGKPEGKKPPFGKRQPDPLKDVPNDHADMAKKKVQETNLGDNPWGIEWTIQEDIHDLSPITPRDDDTPDEEMTKSIDRNAAACGGTMPTSDADLMSMKVDEDLVAPQAPTDRDVWSQGNVCVREESGQFPVYLDGQINQTFPDEDGAIAYAVHLLSGEADITKTSSAPAPEINDEAVLAEARYYAQLAGIGAKPKKIEAEGELADLLVLAGLKF